MSLKAEGKIYTNNVVGVTPHQESLTDEADVFSKGRQTAIRMFTLRVQKKEDEKLNIPL